MTFRREFTVGCRRVRAVARTAALAAGLALVATGAGPSHADVGLPPPLTPSPIERFVEEKAPDVVMAVEETHARIEQSIFERVVRFDDFFGNVRTEDGRRAAYLLRWQNSVRWEEGGRFKFRTTARASFRLPRTGERLRLVISGETEAEPFYARLPEDPGNPGFDRTLANTRLVNTELRYGLIQTPSTNLFLGAGVRLVLPVETFVRSRIQHTHRIGSVSLVRVGETVFWKNTEGLGETTEFDLERQLAPTTILRWANAGTVSQESDGLEWGTELSLLRELSPLSAVTVAGGVFGVTRPSAVVQTYRVLTRYRRNFLRRWLFFELEPEISWPRNPEGAYTPAFAFTYRLELVFRSPAAGNPPR